MFRGVNVLSLDAKGRIAMPTRYREPLADLCAGKLVLTVDPDRCLLVYPYPEWQEIERKLGRMANFDRGARALQRLLIGHATECDMDGHGRIVVAPPLRDFAYLDKRAVLIGQSNKLELWDEQRWNDNCEKWLEDIQSAGQSPSSELASLSL